MIGVVLVTHGNLADEFKGAVEHVVGPQSQFLTVCIGPEDDMEQRRKDIIDCVAKVDDGHEDLSDEKSVLFSLFELVQARPEFKTQLVMVAGGLGERALSSAHVPALVRIAQGSRAEEAALDLLRRWSKSTVNAPLAAAAKGRIKAESKK